jgi:hypothetical protein
VNEMTRLLVVSTLKTRALFNRRKARDTELERATTALAKGIQPAFGKSDRDAEDARSPWRRVADRLLGALGPRRQPSAALWKRRGKRLQVSLPSSSTSSSRPCRRRCARDSGAMNVWEKSDAKRESSLPAWLRSIMGVMVHRFGQIRAALSSTGTGQRSSALGTVQWLLAILFSGLGATLYYGGPTWLIALEALLASIVTFNHLVAFWYFARRDPSALRSESFVLTKMAIERGLVGDDSAGLLEPPPADSNVEPVDADEVDVSHQLPNRSEPR